ncbi:hypothetical protein AAY473_022233, partial [Plecturocebus cupreus]
MPEIPALWETEARRVTGGQEFRTSLDNVQKLLEGRNGALALSSLCCIPCVKHSAQNITDGVSLCCLDWSEMVQSWLNATSVSRVQAGLKLLGSPPTSAFHSSGITALSHRGWPGILDETIYQKRCHKGIYLETSVPLAPDASPSLLLFGPSLMILTGSCTFTVSPRGENDTPGTVLGSACTWDHVAPRVPVLCARDDLPVPLKPGTKQQHARRKHYVQGQRLVLGHDFDPGPGKKGWITTFVKAECINQSPCGPQNSRIRCCDSDALMTRKVN